jgi:hypothetical protein
MFSYYQATSYVYETTTTTNISTGLKMPQTRLESRLVFLFLFTNYFYLQICYQMTTPMVHHHHEAANHNGNP